MMPQDIKDRRDRLQQSLAALSGSVDIIKVETTRNLRTPQLRLSGNIRIRQGNLRLKIEEEFRHLDENPILYGFFYHLAEQEDLAFSNPIIRYECHPDVTINQPDDAKLNPYATGPHFHPDSVTREPFLKLHYPFHRSERKAVIFALIEWIKVDLINRFYIPKAE